MPGSCRAKFCTASSLPPPLPAAGPRRKLLFLLNRTKSTHSKEGKRLRALPGRHSQGTAERDTSPGCCCWSSDDKSALDSLLNPLAGGGHDSRSIHGRIWHPAVSRYDRAAPEPEPLGWGHCGSSLLFSWGGLCHLPVPWLWDRLSTCHSFISAQA